MEKARNISVVIPNYNGEKLLRDYLPATFEALNNTNGYYEIIVVDDCSTDQSVQFLKENYPDIILVINSENRGFSFSCNQGIAVAKYELIFLLNSDVKLFPHYFNPLLKYFDHDDTFGVTGRIIDMDGERIQDAARMPGFNGFKIKTKYFYYNTTADDNLYTFYLSGANALIDAQKLWDLNGLDEIFSPFYGEDLDLGIRAWRNGWKCFYEHQAICRHQQSATTKNYKTPVWVKQIYFRNRFFVHAIHLNNLYYIFWLLQIILIDLLPKIISGKYWVWKSYTNLIFNQKQIRKSRQTNRQLMNKNDSNISLLDVIKMIKKSTKNKSLKKFRV